MDGWHLLIDVLILLGGAVVLGALCERLKQSAIVGYLVAGMLFGPNALGFVGHADAVDILAELGVALLLFTIGLEFSWRRLRRMGKVALLGGGLQVTLTLFLGTGVALLAGEDFRGAVAIGAMIALSSTAVVLRVLSSRAELDSSHGRNALGILLLQDIAVVPLVLIVATLSGEGTAGEMAVNALKTVLLGGVLVFAFILVFNYAVPWILGTQIVSRNRELPILLAAVIALGATLGAHAAGLSAPLGAFLAGMLLGGSPFATQIRADVSALRTLLVTLFFAAVGMLADPMWIIEHWYAVLAVVVGIGAGKAIIIWGVLRMLGQPHRVAVAAGICLGQVGEFSFVLATIARGNVISEDVFMLIVSGTIVTLVLTPYFVVLAPRIGLRVHRAIAKSGELEPRERETGEAITVRPRVIIVGFGPAGQGVAAAMNQSGVPTGVVDLNPRTTRLAQQYGVHGHVGDASQSDVLHHAGLEHAEVIVITLPDPVLAARIIQTVRAQAPEVRIVARARYHVYRWELQMAGADTVVDEEEQVGRRLAAELRKQMRADAKGQKVERAKGRNGE